MQILGLDIFCKPISNKNKLCGGPHDRDLMYWLFQHRPSCRWDDSLPGDVIPAIIYATAIDRARSDSFSLAWFTYHLHTGFLRLPALWIPCLINELWHAFIAYLIYPSCSRISTQPKKTFHSEAEKDVCLPLLFMLKYWGKAVRGVIVCCCGS